MIIPEEYKQLNGMITSSREEKAIVSGALLTSDGVVLSSGLDAFDMLLGSVAFEANHAESAKRQRVMDRVYEKIETVLGGYCG